MPKMELSKLVAIHQLTETKEIQNLEFDFNDWTRLQIPLPEKLPVDGKSHGYSKQSENKYSPIHWTQVLFQ